jgi:hypothetical protein
VGGRDAAAGPRRHQHPRRPPLAHDWVDLIVGEPTKTEMYVLLAGASGSRW